MIPNQLQKEEYRFILLNGKIPFEKDWQNTNNYSYDCKKLLNHKGNYGVLCGKGFLLVIDFDDKDIQDKLIEKLPKGLAIKTGSGLIHKYFICKNGENLKVLDKKKNSIADIQFKSKQVVGAGCVHPKTKKRYEVIDDSEIPEIDMSEIKALFSEWLKKEDKTRQLGYNEIKDKIKDKVSMPELLSKYGINTSKNPTECLWHSSKGGKCFSFNDILFNCFHCDEGGDIFNFVMKQENCKFLQAKNKIVEMFNLESGNEDISILTKRGQIEAFWKIQPFTYDSSKIFKLWNKDLFKWEISDEVDFCNSIYKILGMDTINSRNRSEIIAAFQQVGREHKPEAIKKSWVQFKDRIYDVKTGENFEATPKYDVCNPIPWKVGESEDTPIIDKLYDDWTKGQDPSWKKTLYEIPAYNTSTDQFMQRLIALSGGGANGKGTYVKLNYRFLGMDNCVSSEIKNLSEDKFEAAVLYKKILCVMGEVHYDDLKNTNQLKKLAGEDKISFQFKGKTPFTEDNTATCMCLTNSMPITPDKTMGFYRKWLIVDFLNQFPQIDENIIDNIPDVEFENLAKKSLRILKELYANPHFTNEGNFEERAKRYEERSNPVMRFVEEKCIEEPGEMITLREFTNACNIYLKSKHLRVMNSKQVGGVLRNEGFIVGNRKIEDISAVVVINLTIKTIETIEKLSSKLREESSRDSNSFGSNDSLEPIKEESVEETPKTPTIAAQIPSDKDLLTFIREKGKQGYPTIEFIKKYTEKRLKMLLSKGELVESKKGWIKVLE